MVRVTSYTALVFALIALALTLWGTDKVEDSVTIPSNIRWIDIQGLRAMYDDLMVNGGQIYFPASDNTIIAYRDGHEIARMDLDNTPPDKPLNISQVEP